MPGTGNTLGGYEIVREIARSNDIVYEARDPVMNRRIALKELALPPNLIGQDRRERVERFYREARAAGNLSHPHIVTVFKVGEENGRHFIAMEFLEGDTLRSQLQIGGPLPVTRAVEICSQILDALEYAHQHGVVHRDIKPDNIQILPDGAAKLTDFGIARMGSEPGLTQAGQVFGTPSYMSPEQIAGKPVDRRSDVFSMGVVLYEVLTCRKPFTGDSVVTITYNIMNMEPVPPHGVPPHLQQIIRKAMSKAPEQRYQSAGDMARELRQPAPNPTPFGGTQHVTSLPRINPLPGSVPSSAPVGQPWSPTGSFSSPGSPGAGASWPYSPGAGYIPPPTQAPGAMSPISSAVGIPGSSPALPPLPDSALNQGFREFMIRQGPFLSLLGITVLLILIAVGVFWAVTQGYQGYQDTTVKRALQQANSDAARMLNQGDYKDAKPKLDEVLASAPRDSALAKSASRNLGIYWYYVGLDAQSRKDLQGAQDAYQKALLLFPDRQDEIARRIERIRAALSRPNPGIASGSISSAIDSGRTGPGPGLPRVQASDSPDALPPSSGATASSSGSESGTAHGSEPGHFDPVAINQPLSPGTGNSKPDSSPVIAPRNIAPAAETAHGDVDEAQSLAEYKAGRVAESRHLNSEAVKHYYRSLQLNPGALTDAQARFNSLSDPALPAASDGRG